MRYEEFRIDYIRQLAQLDQEIAENEDLVDQPYLDDDERFILSYRQLQRRDLQEQIEKGLVT